MGEEETVESTDVAPSGEVGTANEKKNGETRAQHQDQFPPQVR